MFHTWTSVHEESRTHRVRRVLTRFDWFEKVEGAGQVLFMYLFLTLTTIRLHGREGGDQSDKIDRDHGRTFLQKLSQKRLYAYCLFHFTSL